MAKYTNANSTVGRTQFYDAFSKKGRTFSEKREMEAERKPKESSLNLKSAALVIRKGLPVARSAKQLLVFPVATKIL